MSVFTRAELEYLRGQRLGRLATVGPDGGPHVVPVGFRYNADNDTIDIGGHGLIGSKKWRDVANEPRIAFVVDDVLPPWSPRLIEIRGLAEQVTAPGIAFGTGYDDALIRIKANRILSFGLGDARQAGRRSRSRRAEEIGPAS
jgi:pyridoxamine 5'-phosphate oxidase family protein